jgi:hypothetical protein
VMATAGRVVDGAGFSVFGFHGCSSVWFSRWDGAHPVFFVKADSKRVTGPKCVKADSKEVTGGEGSAVVKRRGNDCWSR